MTKRSSASSAASVKHSLSLTKGLISLVEDLAKILEAKGWSLSTAESCTGGGLGAALTTVPGSSNWFAYGWITYSNLAKQELLGVSENSLASLGAVSTVVASEMAQGALRISRADLAVSITGVAGPGGGSLDKPVGMVIFGFATKDRVYDSITAFFTGDRGSIRLQAIHFALTELLNLLKQV